MNLENLCEIKDDECLFNVDAISMCPNIDTEEGLAVSLISYETILVKCAKKILT